MTSRPPCWCPLNNRILITFYCLVHQRGRPFLCLLCFLELSKNVLLYVPENERQDDLAVFLCCVQSGYECLRQRHYPCAVESLKWLTWYKIPVWYPYAVENRKSRDHNKFKNLLWSLAIVSEPRFERSDWLRSWSTRGPKNFDRSSFCIRLQNVHLTELPHLGKKHVWQMEQLRKHFWRSRTRFNCNYENRWRIPHCTGNI